MRRRVKKKVVKFTKILIVILCLLGAYLIFRNLNSEVKFTLNGEDYLTLNLNDSYEELGYKAQVCHRDCQEVTSVTIKGNVDSKKVGEQVLTYELKYKGKKYELKRTINVVDNIAPVITLKKDSLDSVTAMDNYDGDLTDKIKVNKENDIYYYTVSDSSGNTTTVGRTNSSTLSLKLKGKEITYLELPNEYEEQGFIVYDDLKSDLTITLNGDVQKEVGSYSLNYKATNEQGFNNVVNRTVNVYDFKVNDANKYWQSLEYYIEDKGYKVSLGYKNLLNNIIFKYNEDKIYYGASLIKTLGALYSYEKLDVDSNPDLKYWVSKAISESDNQCHKNIVNLIGLNNLREYGKSLGATQVLNRGISTDYFGNTWVNDQLIYMEYLYNFVNNNAKGEELKSYFINDHYNKVKFNGAPTVMHKYGYYAAYFHESAIFLDESPYIIVILSEEAQRVVDKQEPIFQDLAEKLYGLNEIVKG